MKDGLEEEKLLTSPLDIPEIVSVKMDRPLLTTKEFLATTPPHELANIFGATEETMKQRAASAPAISDEEAALSTTKNFSVNPDYTPLKVHMKPETRYIIMPPLKQKHQVISFLTSLILLSFITLIGLYIWGGILANEF